MSDDLEPRDLAAEAAVLGAVLLVGEEALRIAVGEGLRAEYFYRPAYGLVFPSMVELHERGDGVDRVLVEAALTDAGRLDEAGGAAGLDRLMADVPSIGHVGEYAGVVRARAVERDRCRAARRVVEAGGGADAWATLRALDAEPGMGSLRMLSGADLLALPEPSWLVEDVLPLAGFAVLYGAPGVGKSFLALDWALSVAAGLPWLGRPVEPRSVLYVAAEGSFGLRGRYRAWLASRGLAAVERIRFVPEALNLLDPGTVETARRALGSMPEPPGLIVVDTMARSMPGGDENAAADVGLLVRHLDLLRGDGLALLVHHARREDEEERGSGALRGAADVMASLTRGGDGALRLRCSKMKDAAEFRPLRLRLQPEGGSCVLSLIVEDERREDDLRERVLAAVHVGAPISTTKVRESVKGRAEAISGALSALKSEGVIRRSGDGWEPCPVDPDRGGTGVAGGDGRAPVPPGGRPVGPPAGDRARAALSAGPEDVSAENVIDGDDDGLLDRAERLAGRWGEDGRGVAA